MGRNLSGGTKGPGLFFILPCIDNITTIDLRTITFDVPPQEILTKDSVTVTVDAVVYYRIFDPVLSVNKVANPQYSTRLLAATSLRNILGTKTLQEILMDKESIAHHMQVPPFLFKFLCYVSLRLTQCIFWRFCSKRYLSQIKFSSQFFCQLIKLVLRFQKI